MQEVKLGCGTASVLFRVAEVSTWVARVLHRIPEGGVPLEFFMEPGCHGVFKAFATFRADPTNFRIELELFDRAVLTESASNGDWEVQKIFEYPYPRGVVFYTKRPVLCSEFPPMIVSVRGMRLLPEERIEGWVVVTETEHQGYAIATLAKGSERVNEERVLARCRFGCLDEYVAAQAVAQAQRTVLLATQKLEEAVVHWKELGASDPEPASSSECSGE